jgi:hypothetical protein
MQRFNYMRDPLFLVGCVAYVVNRWLIKPHFHAGFLHSQFNDLWLVPCALPPILWLHRRLGLRSHDDAPRFSEIFCHLVFWSLLFEWIGPKIVPHAVGELADIFAYAGGAILTALWWNRERWLPNISKA